ncbi:hypothetical protein GCM10027347_59620 [Larkinella harenae]
MIAVYLKILKYVVAYPVVIVYVWHSFPITYKHDRQVFLAQMNRVYEKDQAEKDDAAFALLSERKIPKMPAKGF